MQSSAYLPLGLPQEIRGGEGGISANNVAISGIQVIGIDTGEEDEIGDVLRVGPTTRDVH